MHRRYHSLRDPCNQALGVPDTDRLSCLTLYRRCGLFIAEHQFGVRSGKTSTTRLKLPDSPIRTLRRRRRPTER